MSGARPKHKRDVTVGAFLKWLDDSKVACYEEWEKKYQQSTEKKELDKKIQQRIALVETKIQLETDKKRLAEINSEEALMIYCSTLYEDRQSKFPNSSDEYLQGYLLRPLKSNELLGSRKLWIGTMLDSKIESLKTAIAALDEKINLEKRRIQKEKEKAWQSNYKDARREALIILKLTEDDVSSFHKQKNSSSSPSTDSKTIKDVKYAFEEKKPQAWGKESRERSSMFREVGQTIAQPKSPTPGKTTQSLSEQKTLRKH